LGSRPSEVVVPEVGTVKKKERKKLKVNRTVGNDKSTAAVIASRNMK